MTWHKNPYRLLDPDDYAAHPRASAGALYQYYLREYTVSRPTDAIVFTQMIAAAKRNIEPELLMTRKQQRTDLLVEEALLFGTPAHKIARYIAEREGVTQSAVRQRFKNMGLNVKELRDSLRFSQIPLRNIDSVRTGITDRQIEAWMKRHPVTCIACNCAKAPPGRYLCRNCHDKHRNPDYPAWLDGMIKLARKQHRKDAHNALMVAYEYDEAV
jgi:hypothetical protein